MAMASAVRQTMNAAALTGEHYKDVSSLYKDEKTGKYYVIITQDQENSEDFDRIGFCLSEFGARYRSASRTYIEEHCMLLVSDNALQALSGNA